MEKLWKALAVSVVLFTGTAALAGWQLRQKVSHKALSVGVIGSADGPTSILVTNGRWRGVAVIFFRFTLFFANRFFSSGIGCCTKSNKVRKAGRQ